MHNSSLSIPSRDHGDDGQKQLRKQVCEAGEGPAKVGWTGGQNGKG